MHIVPFITHIIIITFVIEFARNSHMSDFSIFSVLIFLPLLCVHTCHRNCANLRIDFRAGWGQLPRFAPPLLALGTLMHGRARTGDGLLLLCCACCWCLLDS